MSLIQEALKRRDDEDKGLPPAAIPESREAPAVLPQRRRTDTKERKAPAWIAVLSLLVAILALAGAAVGLLFYAVKTIPGSGVTAEKVETGISVKQASAVRTETGFPEIQKAEKIQSNLGFMERRVGIGTAPETEAGAFGTLFRPPVEEASFPTGEAGEAQLVADLKATMAVETETPAPVGMRKKPAIRPAKTVVMRREVDPDAWPRLKLTGVLTRGGRRGNAAILNNEIMSAGDRIEGVTVKEVQSAGVWLEYAEEKRFLRVGRTTE